MDWPFVVLLVVFTWQAGYWTGRRQRPNDKWDWRATALNSGWANKQHLEDPQHYDELGRYMFWGR